MNTIVIYNSRSGSALPKTVLKKKFEEADIEVIDMIDATSDLKTKLQPYLGKNTVIAAYGGDGTLSSVAACLCNTPAVFAPLPGGTLNHFTKDLRIPQNLDEAIMNLKSGTIKKIDAASVNGIIFLNNSSIGFYPRSLREREKLQKKSKSKWFAATLSTLWAFMRYRLYAVTIKGDTFKSPLIFVGNNDYKLEEQIIGDRDKIDSGIISVYAVTAPTKFEFFTMLLRTIFRKKDDGNLIKVWRTSHLTIHTKKKHVRISRDGEQDIVNSPIEYKIIKEGLNIIS